MSHSIRATCITLPAVTTYLSYIFLLSVFWVLTVGRSMGIGSLCDFELHLQQSSYFVRVIGCVNNFTDSGDPGSTY
eukprot:46566-Amphidinium_carterae.1